MVVSKSVAARLAALLLSAPLFLQAATADLGDRIGKVLAAEFTAQPIAIGDRADSPWPNQFNNPRYAVVTVRMNARRSLSLTDYSLVVNGVTYHCIAAARGSEPFVVNPQALYASGNDLARLLFVLDGDRLKAVDGKLKATLKPKLRGRREVALTMTDLGDRNFTECDKIPADGTF